MIDLLLLLLMVILLLLLMILLDGSGVRCGDKADALIRVRWSRCNVRLLQVLLLLLLLLLLLSH